MSESSRHVLVLAYEFPPSAGPGVQRIANFTKYLARAGWRVSVVCAEPLAGRPSDESMLEQVAAVARVVRVPARNVTTAVASAIAPVKRAVRGRGVVGAADGAAAAEPGHARGHAPLSTQVSRWIAVPDDAVRWRSDAVDAAVAVHLDDPADVVFASAPPYSAAMAGVEAAERMDVPCVVDLRDPWRDNAGVNWPTAWHRSRFEALERATLSKAFGVTAVSAPIAEEALEMGAGEALVLPNGYDPERMPERDPDPDAPFTFVFMGRFGTAVTDPRAFFTGLALARGRSGAAKSTRLIVVGPEFGWVDEMAVAYGVADAITNLGYLPHAEALAQVARADAGLIVLSDVPGSKAIYSSKLFEYLGVGIPVLLVGPDDCAAADVIREAEAGIVAPVRDPVAVADAIVRLAADKRRGLALPPARRDVVERFDRSIQSAVLSRLLSDAIAASA